MQRHIGRFDDNNYIGPRYRHKIIYGGGGGVLCLNQSFPLTRDRCFPIPDGQAGGKKEKVPPPSPLSHFRPPRSLYRIMSHIWPYHPAPSHNSPYPSQLPEPPYTCEKKGWSIKFHMLQLIEVEIILSGRSHLGPRVIRKKQFSSNPESRPQTWSSSGSQPVSQLYPKLGQNNSNPSIQGPFSVQTFRPKISSFLQNNPLNNNPIN